MIKIERTSVMNFENAIRGARNPMNSWAKSDSYYDTDGNFVMGPVDLDFGARLCKAGTDHRKFIRQIFVSVDITAPLYWWKEFDTYKVGTVANSCSTMHKIHAKSFDRDDFSHDRLDENGLAALDSLIEYLEGERSDAPEDNLFYAPSHVESIKSAKAIIAEGRELIAKNYNMPMRAMTYSYRLLELHADYADMLTDVFVAKAAGDDDEADKRYKRMMEEMGKREIYFENCYDHCLLFNSFSTVINKRTKYSEPVIY